MIDLSAWYLPKSCQNKCGRKISSVDYPALHQEAMQDNWYWANIILVCSKFNSLVVSIFESIVINEYHFFVTSNKVYDDWWQCQPMSSSLSNCQNQLYVSGFELTLRANDSTIYLSQIQFICRRSSVDVVCLCIERFDLCVDLCQIMYVCCIKH